MELKYFISVPFLQIDWKNNDNSIRVADFNAWLIYL